MLHYETREVIFSGIYVLFIFLSAVNSWKNMLKCFTNNKTKISAFKRWKYVCWRVRCGPRAAVAHHWSKRCRNQTPVKLQVSPLTQESRWYSSFILHWSLCATFLLTLWGVKEPSPVLTPDAPSSVSQWGLSMSSRVHSVWSRVHKNTPSSCCCCCWSNAAMHLWTRLPAY